MRIEVFEQGMVSSSNDILKLNIIDWNRLNGSWDHIGQAIDTVGSWAVGRAVYTVISCDMREAPQREDFPLWDHVGNTHRALAKGFWNLFHWKLQGRLVLSDSPDFFGQMDWPNGRHNHFWGDFGRVSAQAFAMTQKKMQCGDLWISVLSQERQVIIESMTDNAEACLHSLGLAA